MLSVLSADVLDDDDDDDDIQVFILSNACWEGLADNTKVKMRTCHEQMCYDFTISMCLRLLCARVR